MSKDDTIPTIRPFAAILQEHRKGRLHSELGEKLNELVEAVQTLGKGGSLTLKLQIKPSGKGSDMVIVSDDIKVDLPKLESEPGWFFIDSDKNLVRHNPSQPDLPLREVGKAGASGEEG